MIWSISKWRNNQVIDKLYLIARNSSLIIKPIYWLSRSHFSSLLGTTYQMATKVKCRQIVLRKADGKRSKLHRSSSRRINPSLKSYWVFHPLKRVKCSWKNSPIYLIVQMIWHSTTLRKRKLFTLTECVTLRKISCWHHR